MDMRDLPGLKDAMFNVRPFSVAMVDSPVESSSMIFEHTDPATGRAFQVTVSIRDTDRGQTRRFFLTEACPNGQMIGSDGSIIEVPHLLDLEAQAGPNDFLIAADRAGLPVQRIIMVSSGAQASPGFLGIDQAIDAMSYCIEVNRRYSGFPPLEAEKARQIAAERAGRPGQAPIDWMAQIRTWAERQ